jgi:hypothetical protein
LYVRQSGQCNLLPIQMISSFARNALLSTALISVAIGTIYPVQAENSATIQPAIQTNYNKINAAFVRKDIKGATALFTPDYVSISPEGDPGRVPRTLQ